MNPINDTTAGKDDKRQLTLRLPENAYTKLKMMSLVYHKTISEMIADWTVEKSAGLEEQVQEMFSRPRGKKRAVHDQEG